METQNNNIQQTSTHAQQAKKLRRQRTRQIVASIFGIAILVCGIVKTSMIFLDYNNTETSNDAQIEQYISPVNLRASGYIKQVCFTEHQNVKKGDTLLILDGLISQQKAAKSGVSEVSTRRQSSEAAIERARAALEMARLNLSYTVVVAPCDGKLGRRTVEDGQYVSAGQTLTYIMPDTQKWVIANYKETQIENLHVGQEVVLTVDAMDGREFKGRITAISGATGSKYSLVPTDNSAGNFVKIRQRVPVRIDFTGLSKADNERLAAGMMVVVKAKKQ